jgi:cytochrome c-type biogenesis protein CcmH/NrfG
MRIHTMQRLGNKMPTKLLAKTLLAGATFLAASACTTFGGGKIADERLGKDEKNVVVQQGNRAEPVISAHDRRYWLDMRQAKGTLPRMSGALATGESAATIELAKHYLEQRPGDPDGLTMLATALAMARNYDLAAYYAALVEKARPGDGPALNIKGMATMLTPKARIEDFRRAAGYFEQAFAADKTQIAPGLNLGALQLELGNAAAAANTFGEVAKRCGQCAVAMMGYGVAASRSHQFDAAKTAFESVLKKNPLNAGALYNLALVYKNGYNNRKQAEKYLDQLLADSRIKDPSARERAQTVLRSVKSEASGAERAMIADDADAKDAELLMTSGAAEGAAGDD